MSIKYKIQGKKILKLDGGAGFPPVAGNRFFDEFLEALKRDGLDIVEGEDVVTEDYRTLRTGDDGYAPIGDQLDMLFHDARNGTRTWLQHCLSVKTRFPETIERTVAIAPLPDWVKALAGG